jgi:signal transduction histidine kinase
MFAQRPGKFWRGFQRVVALVLSWLAMAFTSLAGAQAITNLHQLTQALGSSPQITADVDIEATVYAASRPQVGVVVVRDETGVELLQLGALDRNFSPGERIRIRRSSCLLRKREIGVEISGQPTVNNDGLHYRRLVQGNVSLPAGKIPLRLEWFNRWRSFGLAVSYGLSNEPPQMIESSSLWHTVIAASGETHFLHGLRADGYEGSWDTLPDFDLLQPVKSGVVTNFDLNFRSRDEGVGIRYSGYWEVPRAGHYQFTVWSDDGSLLFLGDPNVPVISLGYTNVTAAIPSRLLGAEFGQAEERSWTVAEGRVSFVSPIGEGVKFDLDTYQHVISVRLADASGVDLSRLANARVRVTGVARGVMTWDGTPVLGKLFAASAQDLVFTELPPGPGGPSLPITSVAQVQSLPIERARQGLPVRLRGIVTGAIKTTQEHWMSFQDDTRGIFVTLNAISNAVPGFGEMWAVEGHSGAGDFAPVVIADQITRLGEGSLPAPVNPTWTELLNGSRDVQWAELRGLVTDVRSNTMCLYLPGGRLEVLLDGSFESDLRPFLKANVRIRGVLYALWNATTREVRVGTVMMRNATVSVDVPAPADPFDAVARTPRDLLLFDAQASAFRPVKVRGQIVYADATQLFLEKNGTGLRLLPVAKPAVRPGDLVEAVGYPDIGDAQLLLREVLLRKTGELPLPPPRELEESTPAQEPLDATRVRAEGKLLGWHEEGGAPVLEMQSGARLFLARIAPEESKPLALRPGSRLALAGVYFGRKHNPHPNDENQSFELLLNSPADITVLSQPSWWTLPRLFVLVAVLLVVLTFTVIWNTQLRWQVEQRTVQLQREIRERERVEHQRALEAERSRIARDLHDDLGSSLTEISVLASKGQLRPTGTEQQAGLFHAIGASARTLISALDILVWAVDPEDNSLQSLADYLSGYAAEFFSHTEIACRFKVPVSFPPVTLEGRVRHDLLMAVKEALNNIVRHARATEVEFRMALTDHRLEIVIVDNGKGIGDETRNDGHGLKNLAARLQKLGGHCQVEAGRDGGTIVKFGLLLAAENAGPASLDRR